MPTLQQIYFCRRHKLFFVDSRWQISKDNTEGVSVRAFDTEDSRSVLALCPGLNVASSWGFMSTVVIPEDMFGIELVNAGETQAEGRHEYQRCISSTTHRCRRTYVVEISRADHSERV